MPKNNKTVMEAASDYIASRMRTVMEVRKHLTEKGYEQAEIDEAVNDLIGLRYLDDYEYAMRYYEYNTEKHRGGLRAMRELEDRGVDKTTIRYAYEDYVYQNKIDELKMAREIARNVAGDNYPVDDKLVAKVARKLENKGFKKEDIFKVMSDMRRWDNSEYN